MIGGGEGAFIGAVHRIAARLDDRYELVAGALSAAPDKAMRSPPIDPIRTSRPWRARKPRDYTGYPLVRHARAMVESSELGAIRLVQIEYPQGDDGGVKPRCAD